MVLAGGFGWVLLNLFHVTGASSNGSRSAHDPAQQGAVPILALRRYAHGITWHFGGNASAYIAAFMRNNRLVRK